MTSKTTYPVQRVLVVGAILLACVIGGGWWIGEMNGKRVDSEIRARLLNTAMDIAASLDITQVEKITFTASDKGSPEFEAIKNRMIAIKKSLPISGIYSMGQRNGLLYFGPESYLENDPLASPPGTEYKSPPLEALSIFNIKKPRTVGPYTDEYGTFVTAFFPIIEPKTDKVMLVIGIDLLAHDWLAQVRTVRRGPLLISFFVCVLLFCATTTMGWITPQPGSSGQTLKTWPFWSVLFLALFTTALATSYAQSIEDLHPTGNTSKEWLVLAGGVSFSVLLAWLVFSLINTRFQATQLVGQITENLSECELRMKAILDAAQDALIMMDQVGRICCWNPAAERVLGYSSSEALDRSLHDLLSGSSPFSTFKGVGFKSFLENDLAILPGEIIRLEMRRKDGAEVSVQMLFSKVKLKTGWYGICSFHEIKPALSAM